MKIAQNLAFPPRDRLGCKFCGFTTIENTRACISVGADTLGFNFWPKSKRYLDPEKADWLLELPPDIVRVGVFVNASPEEIAEIYRRGLIHIAQLHGDESPDDCSQLAELGIPTIKAIAVRDGDSLTRIRAYPGASAILLDAFLPGEYGGGGEPFDWKLARRAVDENPDIPIILSGGLDARNVREAVSQIHPAAIDLASGVESSPGVKDPEAVAQVLKEAEDAAKG